MKKEIIDTSGLAHTKRNCKYHVFLHQSTEGKCFSKKNAKKQEKCSDNYVDERRRNN